MRPAERRQSSRARDPSANRHRTPVQQVRIPLAGRVVQVLHGGVDVRVAHPLLQLQDRDGGVPDHLGPERVAQVVEAQVPQAGAPEREPCSGGRGRRRRGSSPQAPGEDQVVLADRLTAVAASRASASATAGAIGTVRPLPDLGVVSARSV